MMLQSFDHEGHGVIDFLRRACIDRAGLFVGRRVGAVAAHAVVQAGTTRGGSRLTWHRIDHESSP